jgi:hypothetical protein
MTLCVAWIRRVNAEDQLVFATDSLITGGYEYPHGTKLQAPGCGRLFRAGPNSTRVYCPNPNDPQKASLCGSRVTTQRNRARQGRKS